MQVLSSRSATAPGVSFRVLLQLGDASLIPDAGLYDTAEYDTATYGAIGDAYMRDVSEYVEAFETENGRQEYTSRFRSGKAIITMDNTTGVWTPAGGGQLPGFLRLRPGRICQIFIDTPDSTVQIYEGFVSTVEDRHDETNLTTRIRCLDLMGYSAPVANTVEQPPQGGGELSWQRIQRINEHEFTPAPRLDIRAFNDDEFTTMNSTTMAADALSLLQITADSEGGGVWMTPEGSMAFSSLSYFRDKAAGPVEWHIGEMNVGVYRLSRSEWSVQRIVNETHFARTGGSEVVASNSGSIGVYGRRTFRRLDLETNDEQRVTDLGQRIVENLANDRVQVPGLTLLPTNADEYLVAATAAIGDKVRVTVQTIHGWSYTVLTQIFGISHSVNASMWTTSFLLDDTEVVQQGAYTTGYSDGYDV